MEKKYRYTGYFMILLVPLVVLAFYPSYFGQIPVFGEHIKFYDHLHALIASVWIFLLILQPLLVARRKYTLHKKLGRLSYFIFPALIVSFIPRMIVLIQSPDPRNVFYPLADCLVLVSLYSLAILHRKNITWHMRFMIAAALVFLGPTIGRIGYYYLHLSATGTQTLLYLLMYSILGSLVLYDKVTTSKVKPYYVAMGLYLPHLLIYFYLFV